MTDKDKLIKTMRSTAEFQSYRITQLTEDGWKKDDEIRLLKTQVAELKEALDKLMNTPPEANGVEVKVNFWTQYGSRLPSSFQTFWMKGEAK